MSLPAKLTVTLFLALVGGGYGVALVNIYAHHHDADLEPGLTIDDLRRVYHGLEKTFTSEMRESKPSEMLKEVSPGGRMRKHLEAGGPEAVRALIGWLEGGAKEADFGKAEQFLPGDPSPQQVIARQCTRCHNAADGEASEKPYAESAGAAPQYAMVIKLAQPIAGPIEKKTETVYLAPTGWKELVQITHAHVFTIPLFALAVAGLFLLTGLRPAIKLLIGPLPLLATLCDLAGWWLARPFEPFIYVIAAAGAVFGASLGFQILCVFGSMWFGRKPQAN
jgi:hypothetical protein